MLHGEGEEKYWDAFETTVEIHKSGRNLCDLRKTYSEVRKTADNQ